MVSAHDFAMNIVMVINIAIHKTFSIYDLVNKLFVATILSIQCCNIQTDMYRYKNNFMKIKIKTYENIFIYNCFSFISYVCNSTTLVNSLMNITIVLKFIFIIVAFRQYSRNASIINMDFKTIFISYTIIVI